jgi:hypothetical protein
MTDLANRRRRIAKIRSVELRVAEHHLAQAEKGVMHIRQIHDRISALRSATQIGLGAHDGMTLGANTEMAIRLNHAKRSTAVPLAEAIDRRDQQQLLSIHARQREDGSNKLAEAAARKAQIEFENKTNANRIYRQYQNSKDIGA